MVGIVNKVYCNSFHFSFHSLQVYSLHFCRKFCKSLSLFKILSPSFIFKWIAVTNDAFEICRNVKLLHPDCSLFLRKLFDTRFSYQHCNFSRACRLVKMAFKTVTRSMEAFRSKTWARKAVCVRTDDALRFSEHIFSPKVFVIRAALGINY